MKFKCLRPGDVYSDTLKITNGMKLEGLKVIFESVGINFVRCFIAIKTSRNLLSNLTYLSP